MPRRPTQSNAFKPPKSRVHVDQTETTDLHHREVTSTDENADNPVRTDPNSSPMTRRAHPNEPAEGSRNPEHAPIDPKEVRKHTMEPAEGSPDIP